MCRKQGDRDLVRLMWAADPATTAIVQDVLSREGIPTILTGERAVRLNWGSGSTSQRPALMVQRRHLARAVELVGETTGGGPART